MDLYIKDSKCRGGQLTIAVEAIASSGGVDG